MFTVYRIYIIDAFVNEYCVCQGLNLMYIYLFIHSSYFPSSMTAQRWWFFALNLSGNRGLMDDCQRQQSVWNLVKENVPYSELPEIRAAIGESLIDLYSELCSEVNEFYLSSRLAWLATSLKVNEVICKIIAASAPTKQFAALTF